MKAEITNKVKTRNGGRKTVSKEVVNVKPISMDEFNGKKPRVSNERQDYKVKPISEEKRVAGKKAMYDMADKAMNMAKSAGKQLKEGFSTPQPNSVKATAQRVKARELAKKPKAKSGR